MLTPTWPPNSSSSWSNTSLVGPQDPRPTHSQRPRPRPFGPGGCGKPGTHQQISNRLPGQQHVGWLSHHFHFPPPLKQPPSSLALEAPQPKLLHTLSYCPDLPLTSPERLRNWERDGQRYLPEKPRPGPSPRGTSRASSPATWGWGLPPPSRARPCRRVGDSGEGRSVGEDLREGEQRV